MGNDRGVGGVDAAGDPVADLVTDATAVGLRRNRGQAEMPPLGGTLSDALTAENGEVPERIGRYQVTGKLGEGGMGVVYAAFDGQLERQIAIKLLLVDADDPVGGRGRLLREAQAMAKLSHRNVVAVHDVGTHNGQVFVAMEFIAGKTLRAWLGEGEHTWRERLAVMEQAGAGLAAAHEAGIVHRDFKPDNVIVADTGEVKVLDFGLARAELSDASEPPAEAKPARLPTGKILSTPLTRTGALMGTPAYMAPEQHRSKPTDARTDQFAFGVTLYEALFDRRPFDGAAYGELAKQVLSESPIPVPADPGIPPACIAAILRCLERDPDDRWPSMESLLAALAAAASPRKARWPWAVAALGALALGGIAAARISGGGVAPAEACSAKTQLKGIWDQEVRARLGARIASSTLGYAAAAWKAMELELSGFATEWGTRYEAACIAQQNDPKSVLALQRRECLDRKLLDLQAQIDALEFLAPETALSGSPGTLLLSVPGDCDNDKLVAATPLMPTDMAITEKITRTRRALQAEFILGIAIWNEGIHLDKLGSHITRVTDYGQQIIEAGHKPAIIESEYEISDRSLEGSVMPEQAQARLAAALELAIEERFVEYEGAILVSRARHGERAGYGEAERKAELASGASRLRSAGEPTVLQLKYLNTASRIAQEYDEPERAAEFAEAYLELVIEKYGASSPQTAFQLSWTAALLLGMKPYQERALELLRERREMTEKFLGPYHPATLAAQEEIADVLSMLDRKDERDRALNELVATIEAHAPYSKHVALRARYSLAFGAFESGKFASAAPAVEQIVPQLKALRVPVALERVESLRLLATIRMIQGRYPEARTLAEEAVAPFERGQALEGRSLLAQLALVELDAREGRLRPWDHDHGEALIAEFSRYGPTKEYLRTYRDITLGNAEWLLGRRAKALELYRQAAAQNRYTYDIGMHAKERLGTALVEQGDMKAALVPLEEVMAAHGNGALHGFTPAAQFSLARALWRTGGDRERASALAVSAKLGFETFGPGRADDAARVDRWLRSPN